MPELSLYCEESKTDLVNSTVLPSTSFAARVAASGSSAVLNIVHSTLIGEPCGDSACLVRGSAGAQVTVVGPETRPEDPFVEPITDVGGDGYPDPLLIQSDQNLCLNAGEATIALEHAVPWDTMTTSANECLDADQPDASRHFPTSSPEMCR